MRNVLMNCTAQPIQKTAFNSPLPNPPRTFHTTAVIGGHCQNSNSNARLVTTTYVLRSTARGTIVVHQRLNEDRAITLCCAANTASSSRLITIASSSGALAPTSIDFDTAMLPTNAMAYRNV